MSLVEEYYELNEAEEVSVVWKILHILLYGCAGAFGLWCGFTLANLRQKLDDRCYLFTEVKVSPKDDKLDHGNINWESDSWCDYYQFSMVSSFIVGIIWGTLFLMCGKGGKSLTGLPQPWRIVSPSLIFNFIYFIITLSTAISIQRGTDYFCARYDLDIIRQKSLTESCEPLKLLLKKDLYLISLQIEIVVKTSWSCVVSWFILFLLSFFRILFVVDYRMYKICVFKIDDTVQNKKEEVLRITNYEEPKKLYFGKDDDRGISDSETTPEYLETGSRKKAKNEKKSTRQHFNISSRSPLNKRNTVFYETADIRMLSRQKKRKKTSKALDEAFGKNKTSLGFGLRKSIKIQSNSDVSGNSKIPTFLYQYSKELFDEDDEDGASSFSTTQQPDFNEDWNESGSGSEILVGNFDSNRFLRFKKQI